MLRIKGLTKRYRTGDLALKGIDIDVLDGQVMALIGPSGAGKSTVIRCINRLVEPTAGSITLNDVDIAGLGSAELRRMRRRMGMIFQEYALVERLSVMENVLTGRLGYVGFWQSWFRRFPQADVDEAFRLLADTEKTIVNAYGVWGEKSLYGRRFMGTNRVTYLIDEKGRIAAVWPKVAPAEHAREILDAVGGGGGAAKG